MDSRIAQKMVWVNSKGAGKIKQFEDSSKTLKTIPKNDDEAIRPTHRKFRSGVELTEKKLSKREVVWEISIYLFSN